MATTLFSGCPHAKTREPRPAWEKPLGNRLSWRFPQRKRRSRQTRRAALGKIEAEPVYDGDPAYFRWRLRQNPRLAWGKSNGNPSILAIPPRKSGVHAKTRDSRAVWENSQRNPFIMAILPRKATFAPKPTSGVGKFEVEPVYHGDRPEKRDWIGEAFRISKAVRIRPTQNSEPPSSPPDFQRNALEEASK